MRAGYRSEVAPGLRPYWAPRIGFYGGIDYGFGYFGVGFVGGYWRDRDFYYNRSVTNVTNVNITNVYNSEINNRVVDSRASYNGGDGVRARPTPIELAAAREPHRGFTALQRLQAQTARTVPGLLASVNHGRPNVAATARPGMFTGRNVEPARNASNGRFAQPAWHARNAPSISNRYNAGRNDAVARDSALSQPPTRAWTQTTAPRNDRARWNPPSVGAAQRSMPSRPAASNYYNYRQPELQVPAATCALGAVDDRTEWRARFLSPTAGNAA